MNLTQPFGEPSEKDPPAPPKSFRSSGSTEGDDFWPGGEEGNE